ncbi:hypothetical protein [Clostridium formicaceticum]|uniref:Molecular chaperone n=1 Tax=Clostridium formicaceticum TaxID=1497 RepID=A0AAC9WHJ9_9CLOT|nr:hypothetical protein [Clostridium formicaceticum]AOY74677.1 hypothetical protein BJL90_01130 [Clostridium formicaceticum]ARE89053.1 hypothetical protein CLFO_34590 [Clostridium formicaceticum]
MYLYTREELDSLSYEEVREIAIDLGVILGSNPKYVSSPLLNAFYNINNNTITMKKTLIEDILDYQKEFNETSLEIFQSGGEVMQDTEINNEIDLFDCAQNLINIYIANNDIIEDKNIGITAKITLYKELDITLKDNYRAFSSRHNIEGTWAFVLDENKQLCGILDVIKTDEEDGYCLIADKNRLVFKDSKNKDYFILFYENKSNGTNIMKLLYETSLSEELDKDLINISNMIEFFGVAVEVDVRELEETQTTLCIDFGTTNTTVGCYIDEHYVKKISNNDLLNGNIVKDDINFVDFYTDDEKNKKMKMVPTVVYVLNCKDESNIQFLFGYKAQKAIKQANYCPKATVFYGIKRWINNINEIEIIRDNNGNKQEVSRKYIIKKYMEYIIYSAEQQFKCKFRNLHLTSPVKLKDQFLALFEDILPQYKIEKNNALDEGVAVLYDTISEKIESGNYGENGEIKKALVIDCGGGTTDLASCKFSIKEGEYSYLLDMYTSFENGDTNFGGNNITYRIMQYMKILFANNHISRDGKKLDIDTLIPVQSDDIFRSVDNKKNASEIYEAFEKHYEEAEKLIPTKYKLYENKELEEYNKVRNNFYFLWEIAEDMKKQFFEKTNMLRNAFSNSKNLEDLDLNVTVLDKWQLAYVNGSGKLDIVTEFPKIIFNIKEINKLIKADIYEVIRNFLDDLYNKQILTEYTTIKLTGQSCKIGIFKEALKEFVPGKAIKYKPSSEEDTTELKLACLKGVIKYINSKKQGDITPNIVNEIPVIPYSLSSQNFKGKEIELIKAKTRADEAIGSIGKPIGFNEVKFLLKDADGQERDSYKYFNKDSAYKEISVGDITKEYPLIKEEDVNNIMDNSVRIFVLGATSNWGFFVLPVKKENHKVTVGKKEYFSFENELSTLSYFDGTK